MTHQIKFGPFSFLALVKEITDSDSYKIWVAYPSQIDVPTEKDAVEYTLYSKGASLKIGNIVFVKSGYSPLESKNIICEQDQLSVLGSIQVTEEKVEPPKKQSVKICYLPFCLDWIEDVTIPVWKISPYQI